MQDPRRMDGGEVGGFEFDVRQLTEAHFQSPALLGRRPLDQSMQRRRVRIERHDMSTARK